MLQTITRPFTVAERERLEAELLEAVSDPKPNYEEAFGVGATCAFVGLLLSLPIVGVAAVLHVPVPYLLAILGTGASIGFALGFREELWLIAWQAQTRKEHSATLAARLGRGEIEETTVMASAVATVTEPDDADFLGFFFDLGDNRVLFLWEDTVYGDNGDELSPSSAFTYTRYPGEANSVGGLSIIGEPLEPSRRFSFKPTGDDWSDTFHNGAVFENVSLETLETDLPYLFALAPHDPNEPER